MKTAIIAFFFCICLLVHNQSVPQITPANSMVGQATGYKITYYTFKTLSATSSYFRVDFSQSKIQVPQGTLSNCQVRYNSILATTLPECDCASKVCTFKPKSAAFMNTKVEIDFEGAVNPYYLSNQELQTTIYFSPMVTA